MSTVLILLIWSRPFERRSGNLINIFIQVVRVLSIACIFVFVEELGISQTTQTVTGVVLIALQSILTAALAILIATNALIMCWKPNPHRKRRKEAEKLNKDIDHFIPLDSGKEESIYHEKLNSKPLSSSKPEPFFSDTKIGQDSPVFSARDRGTESRDGLIDSDFPMHRVVRTDQSSIPQAYRGVAF